MSALPVEETELIPLCTWCQAPIKLDDQRIAWCTGSQVCRDKQLSCAVKITRDGADKYLFVPSPRQTEVMMSTAPNLFVYGNRGGGKSVCIRWMCHAIATAVPGFKYAILRTSYPELMKNHLVYLEDEMNQFGGEKEGFRYNKTDHICYYPNGSIGYYSQCATDADVKKILGAEVALVVFDEAPTFDWHHMRLIAASIRVPTGSGLIPMTRYLGNPIGESIDELWKYFIDHDVDLGDDPEYRPEDWVAIEMRIQDNPHLDAKQYWKQFSGLPKHYLKAWREGVRVEEHTLFEFLPTQEGRPYHVVNEVPRFGDDHEPLFYIKPNGEYVFPDWVRIYRGYDHGYWPDPAVCLWFAVYGRRILCFKEKTWYRTLASEIAKDIKRESKGMRVVTTFCDPSIDITTGADVLTIKQKMENQGVPMDCGVNDREIFADAIHTMLDEKIGPSTPRCQFLNGTGAYLGCPMLIKYLPRMKYDERNPAAMAEHKYDHWPVAFAYFGMTQIPTTSPQKTGTPKRYQLPKKGRRSSAARVLARRLDRNRR